MVHGEKSLTRNTTSISLVYPRQFEFPWAPVLNPYIQHLVDYDLERVGIELIRANQLRDIVADSAIGIDVRLASLYFSDWLQILYFGLPIANRESRRPCFFSNIDAIEFQRHRTSTSLAVGSHDQALKLPTPVNMIVNRVDSLESPGSSTHSSIVVVIQYTLASLPQRGLPNAFCISVSCHAFLIGNVLLLLSQSLIFGQSKKRRRAQSMTRQATSEVQLLRSTVEEAERVLRDMDAERLVNNIVLGGQRTRGILDISWEYSPHFTILEGAVQ